MQVKAILHSYKRSDGTRDVKIYCSGQGRKKYYSTGIKIRPDQWDGQKVVRHAQAGLYNIEIQKLIQEYRAGMLAGLGPDQLEQSKISGGLVTDFLDIYIAEINQGMHGIKKSTGKAYQSVLTRLTAFCPNLSWEQITMDWYKAYFQYLIQVGGSAASFGNHIKILKKIMRVAQSRGLHNNLIYKEREFKALKPRPGGKVYLQLTEIEALERLDLSSMPGLDRERDRFLISYYLLMRYDDSTKIRADQVHGNNYVYTQGKTGAVCYVPISGKARKLMEKREYDFSGHSNVEANRKIKTLGSMAEITGIVQQGTQRGPKCQFLTTHTARRSAATNLFLQGAGLETIARLGGWKSNQTLKIYLRASGLEVAENARRLDFFK